MKFCPFCEYRSDRTDLFRRHVVSYHATPRGRGAKRRKSSLKGRKIRARALSTTFTPSGDKKQVTGGGEGGKGRQTEKDYKPRIKRDLEEDDSMHNNIGSPRIVNAAHHVSTTTIAGSVARRRGVTRNVDQRTSVAWRGSDETIPMHKDDYNDEITRHTSEGNKALVAPLSHMRSHQSIQDVHKGGCVKVVQERTRRGSDQSVESFHTDLRTLSSGESISSIYDSDTRMGGRSRSSSRSSNGSWKSRHYSEWGGRGGKREGFEVPEASHLITIPIGQQQFIAEENLWDHWSMVSERGSVVETKEEPMQHRVDRHKEEYKVTHLRRKLSDFILI